VFQPVRALEPRPCAGCGSQAEVCLRDGYEEPPFAAEPAFLLLEVREPVHQLTPDLRRAIAPRARDVSAVGWLPAGYRFLVGKPVEHVSGRDAGVAVALGRPLREPALVLIGRSLEVARLRADLKATLVDCAGKAERFTVGGGVETDALQDCEGSLELVVGRQVRILVSAERPLLGDPRSEEHTSELQSLTNLV